ncbi:hypothetical protein TNIN_109661 [Trichonephila inaurata madagascariensis]|uniref:Uncharacterized protein n=1 Tax=Trichonephila inaurata madagascariensis TaxID=2747483 RepID=A0A8X6I8P7_9ARAC|nr:hypothetical protein TNIN_109661 [Trichonephila inaurata madagascariensis]
MRKEGGLLGNKREGGTKRTVISKGTCLYGHGDPPPFSTERLHSFALHVHPALSLPNFIDLLRTGSSQTGEAGILFSRRVVPKRDKEHSCYHSDTSPSTTEGISIGFKNK